MPNDSDQELLKIIENEINEELKEIDGYLEII
jgi:hypothetical protein